MNPIFNFEIAPVCLPHAKRKAEAPCYLLAPLPDRLPTTTAHAGVDRTSIVALSPCPWLQARSSLNVQGPRQHRPLLFYTTTASANPRSVSSATTTTTAIEIEIGTDKTQSRHHRSFQILTSSQHPREAVPPLSFILSTRHRCVPRPPSLPLRWNPRMGLPMGAPVRLPRIIPLTSKPSSSRRARSSLYVA